MSGSSPVNTTITRGPSCENIRTTLFKKPDGGFLCGIQWEGPDKWGLKGEGSTPDEAITKASLEFFRWLQIKATKVPVEKAA